MSTYRSNALHSKTLLSIVAGILAIIGTFCLPISAAVGPLSPLSNTDHAGYVHRESTGGTAPVTITAKLTFGEATKNTSSGVWLAGFAAGEDQAPTALSLTFSQVSAGWLGAMWGVQLQSDAGLIPGRLLPQAGSAFLADSEFILLQSAAPKWGHEYEARLGYDPATGRTTVALYDVTADESVITRNLQLLPYEGQLHSAAGYGATTGDVAPFVHLTEFKTAPIIVPEKFSWWVMQRKFDDDRYLTTVNLDRRLDTAVSVHIPWDNLGGNLGVTVADANGTVMERAVYDGTAEYVPLAVDGFSAGPHTVTLAYTAGDETWILDRREVTAGVLDVVLRDVVSTTGESGRMQLEGLVQVESDGPVGPTTVGLRAAVTLHGFTYDPLRGEAAFTKEAADDVVLLRPVKVSSFPKSQFRFTAQMPMPELDGTMLQLAVEPITPDAPYAINADTYTTWVGEPAAAADWAGFLRDERIAVTELAPGVEMVTLRGRLPAGPVEMFVIAADVTKPGVSVDALVGGSLTSPATSRWPRSQPSEMVATSGAVAGVNAAFFDISHSMNPLGIVMRSGDILKTDRAGFDNAVGIDADGKPYFGQWVWSGGVQRPDGSAYRGISGLNVTSPAGSLALYRSPATYTIGTVDADQPMVELVLKELPAGVPETAPWGVERTASWRGQVIEVRQGRPRSALQPGIMILAGAGELGDYLLNTFGIGDIVEFPYRLLGRGEWPYVTDWRNLRAVVSGSVMLLRDGVYGDGQVTSNRDRHPRTAVAVSLDQSRLYVLVVDGRSSRSVGMTYKEMADFFRHIGAFHALNLDGGGSTGLAVRDPATQRVTVLNTPSDGRQRYVPDGIGIFYNAPQ